ncbi:hypothetical protein ACQI4F_03490 [Mycolicibacterium vaccae]|uniref:hypothetical protein n=1 Tax=Mycolicibacterium vaccae TaxID=1810 RepID=UPI003CE9939C
MGLVVTLLVWESRSEDGSAPFADDGVDRTVGLLTEKDPVCGDWIRYADELADELESWSTIAKAIPASRWDPEQRRVFETAANTMGTAAAQFESILPLARHVTLQELISQTIAHWRAYVAEIPTYDESDAMLARVATNFGGAVTYMCTAAPIVQRVAGVRAGSAKAVDEATKIERFQVDADSFCVDFLGFVKRQNAVLTGWEATDPTVPAIDWTPEQRELNLAVIEVLATDANHVRAWAAQVEDPILADLLLVYGSYVDAFITALPTYEPDDNQIWRVATLVGGGIASACEAA